MGLRDRLSSNYFIPLVAGVDSAAKAGLLAPADVYGPGLDQGGGLGGIGAGDGGDQTPDDPTINKPSILEPANGSTVNRLASAASSAFSSTNGQTHIKSRWVMEYRGETDDSIAPLPFVVFDSGPTAADLTTLALTDLLGAGTRYAIKVRHKGSGGGWSPWSDYSIFDVTCATPGTTYDTTIQLWYTGTGGTTRGWLDPALGCAFNYGGPGVYTSTSGNCYEDGSYVGGISQGYGCYRGEGELTSVSPSTPPGQPCADPYTAPGDDTCADLPAIPDTPEVTDPPPPVFVPPASQPPVPPPLPGVPESQAKFAKIVVDLSQSYLQGLATDSSTPITSLKKVIADGGVSYADLSPARLVLVFQNTGTGPGCINYFVKPDDTSATVQLGDYTNPGADAAYSFNNPMLSPREVCLEAKAFKTELLTLWMPVRPIPPESHEFTVDLGDDSPLKFKVGFGETLITPP